MKNTLYALALIAALITSSAHSAAIDYAQIADEVATEIEQEQETPKAAADNAQGQEESTKEENT